MDARPARPLINRMLERIGQAGPLTTSVMIEPNVPLKADCVYFPTGAVIWHFVGNGPKQPAVLAVGLEGYSRPEALPGLTGPRKVAVRGSAYEMPIKYCDSIDQLAQWDSDFRAAAVAQIAGWAGAHASHTVERLIARWLGVLARCASRLEIEITQDQLAAATASRRPGISEGLAALEYRGLIRSSRKFISVRDINGLEAFANSPRPDNVPAVTSSRDRAR